MRWPWNWIGNIGFSGRLLRLHSVLSASCSLSRARIVSRRSRLIMSGRSPRTTVVSTLHARDHVACLCQSAKRSRRRSSEKAVLVNEAPVALEGSSHRALPEES